MSGRVRFHRAGPADAPDVLRLLRVPTGGRYALSFERAPDPFADPLPPQRHAFVLARDAATGETVGLCERSVREGFIEGQRVLLPYLGALRIAPEYRHRIAILKGGFATLREQVEQADEHPLALTAIDPANTAALRVLTAGVVGLPRYTPLGDYATLMLRAGGSGDSSVTEATEADREDIDTLLAHSAARRTFAPTWSAAAIGWPLLVLRRAGRLLGVAGVWDQRAFRQVVVHGYPRGVGAARPLLNALAPLARLPALPRPGEAIAQAYLSPLALSDEDDTQTLLALVRAALAKARAIGLGVLTLGLPAAHPWRAAVRRQGRAVEYRTRLFGVQWGDAPLPAGAPFPDVALL